eukprot:scaffold241956_cov29-Tisochrysis_lutea.AAC.9
MACDRERGGGRTCGRKGSEILRKGKGRVDVRKPSGDGDGQGARAPSLHLDGRWVARSPNCRTTSMSRHEIRRTCCI